MEHNEKEKQDIRDSYESVRELYKKHVKSASCIGDIVDTLPKGTPILGVQNKEDDVERHRSMPFTMLHRFWNNSLLLKSKNMELTTKVAGNHYTPLPWSKDNEEERIREQKISDDPIYATITSEREENFWGEKMPHTLERHFQLDRSGEGKYLGKVTEMRWGDGKKHYYTKEKWDSEGKKKESLAYTSKLERGVGYRPEKIEHTKVLKGTAFTVQTLYDKDSCPENPEHKSFCNNYPVYSGKFDPDDARAIDRWAIGYIDGRPVSKREFYKEFHKAKETEKE